MDRTPHPISASPLPLRIGVHLADVIISGDDLIGDGVNVAARIQESAEPSSVFASQTIFEHVRRNSPYVFEDLGLHTLKNISEQMRLYKVVGNMPRNRFQTGHAVAHPRAGASVRARWRSCLLKWPGETRSNAISPKG